jgi:hypothetical protein
VTKKITSVSINNCRAYFGQYDALILPNGENLLVYGENGSGKSSLYKALNNYFLSSLDPAVPFVKNRHNPGADGNIRLGFCDFDNTAQLVVAGSEASFDFSSTISDHSVPFIQAAALSKGFLDYTDLLKVYFHQEERPNLFDLIVVALLGTHIPIRSGGNFQFATKWKQLQDDLTILASKRTDRCHIRAFNELPVFETHLRSTLRDIFRELNRLLLTYFPELGIELRFTLAPIIFHYPPYKHDWFTTSDLRLSVIKDGVEITNGYNDFLNEARLSALSICMYLASLKRNPTTIELKVLYLDDVFIGLDAGNRLPILNILNGEFSDFQIFVSTYDRHWFELSKRYFDINSSTKWKSIELYVGKEEAGLIEITKPIVVIGESNFEKAVKYLHHRTNPDYPAAANYFRKSLEELIKDYVPLYELADTDNTQLPDHMLTKLLKRTQHFIAKTSNSLVFVNQIYGLLHNLLHPLSHHEITSPVYKNELIILETAISRLRIQLKDMDIPNKYQCCLEPGKRLKLTFTVNAITNHFLYYEVILKDPIIISNNGVGGLQFATGALFLDRCDGINNGTPIAAFSARKNDPRFSYTSLQNALDVIYSHIITTNPVFAKPTPYETICQYHDGTTWQPLISRLIWIP